MPVQRRRRWQQQLRGKVLMPWISCDDDLSSTGDGFLAYPSICFECYTARDLDATHGSSTRPWVPWFIYGVRQGHHRRRRRHIGTSAAFAYACVLFVASAFPATANLTSQSPASQPSQSNPALAPRNSLRLASLLLRCCDHDFELQIRYSQVEDYRYSLLVWRSSQAEDDQIEMHHRGEPIR